MRDHSNVIRYALMASYLYVRAMEVTDDITRMAIQLIHRLTPRSDTQIHREFLADLKRVDGKMQILSRVAEAVVEQPDGIVREVIFSQVKEETFHNLVTEFRASGPELRLLRQTVMQRKFARHYRRMLPALLESVRFRSDNRFQPVIEALAAIQRNLTTHQEHFSEQVPIEGVVPPRWKEKVFEQVNGETKINRRYYELCVLEKLERALKCKEVWVEGSYDFRNPSEDLPSDWSDEQRRTLHYQALGKPLDAQAFVRLLRTRMGAALTNFNRVLPELNHLRIFRPRQNDDRGLWALAKLEPQPEPQSLGLIKEKIGGRYGMLDLLDVFVEADRLVDFTRFFTHSGTREVRSREALRPLLILDLFGEATNMGIKQVANANDRYGYDELLYVRKTYFSPEALRNANGAVVNKLLALRNPRLWGEGASSGHFTFHGRIHFTFCSRVRQIGGGSLVAVVRCCDEHRHGLATHNQIKLAFSALDRIYSHLLRELPGGAVGVEPADKSDFLVDCAATGPVDASDSESRSRWRGRIGKHWIEDRSTVKGIA